MTHWKFKSVGTKRYIEPLTEEAACLSKDLLEKLGYTYVKPKWLTEGGDQGGSGEGDNASQTQDQQDDQQQKQSGPGKDDRILRLLRESRYCLVVYKEKPAVRLYEDLVRENYDNG